MHYLVLIGAFIFFVAIAPLKVSLVTGLALVLLAGTIALGTRLMVGTTATVSDVFKAVGFAFLFALLALFGLASLQEGAGIDQFCGLSAYGVFALIFLSCALGFKLGLGTTFGASVVIAFGAAVVSGLFLSMAY